MGSMLTSAISSISAQLAAIPYAWVANNSNTAFPTTKAKPTVLFQYGAVWNNQIKHQDAGARIPADYPQYYVQPILGRSMKLGGQVYLYPDAIFRVHIADWQIDAADGTLDQNLQVIGWRDLVKSKMEGFFPLRCTMLTEHDEAEDFDHEGVYHYTIDFKCAFTDLKGGIFDPNQSAVVSVFPPYPVQETIGFNDEPLPPVRTIYGYKVCAILVYIVETPDGSTQTLDNGDVIPLQYALNDDGYDEWVSGDTYIVGDTVNYMGLGYECSTNNSDTVFDAANWIEVPPSFATLTIPELTSYPGISVLTPFIIGNNPADTVAYDGDGTFNNSTGGGFNIGNDISFNASLPNYLGP